MRNGSRYLATMAILAFGGVAVASCSGDDDPAGPPGGGGTPASVAVVSGDAQTGKTLEELEEPLVVRVSNAQGASVSGATVTWSIVQGGGTLSGASSTTNAQGQASIEYTPGPEIETSEIEASVSGVATAAILTIETTVMVIEMEGIAFVAPDGSDAVTIPLGTTVEWVNRDAVQHTARSFSMPPGTAMINSGLLSQGERYSYTPTMTGTWTYLCEVHPAQMTDATITVQ